MTDTSWTPDLIQFPGPKYLALTRALRDAIRLGHLKPGGQLPTVRDLAYQHRCHAGHRVAGLSVGHAGRPAGSHRWARHLCGGPRHAALWADTIFIHGTRPGSDLEPCRSAVTATAQCRAGCSFSLRLLRDMAQTAACGLAGLSQPAKGGGTARRCADLAGGP